MAKQLAKRLEPYALFFIEEPLLPRHISELRDLYNQTSIPVAVRSSSYTHRSPAETFIAWRATLYRLDVRPYYDVGLAPHCPIGMYMCALHS